MQRHERFPADYLTKLESLSQELITYIIKKYKETPLETKELNKNLANFFKVIFYYILLTYFRNFKLHSVASP